MGGHARITLSDEQYERLRAESHRTGLGIDELVQRALDRTYGVQKNEVVLRGLDESFGSWPDRDYDGASYVDGLRGGMAARLRR